MPITSFPPAPSRADPNTFADLADAYLGHLENPFVAEANALEANVNAKEASANLAATNALASANAAANTANVTAWVSGAFYNAGESAWDTTNFLTYRRKVSGANVVRPGLDTANWVLLSGQGDAALAANQTFSGSNTFSQPINGSGANLTNLNASNLASGTVPAAQLPVASDSVAGAVEFADTSEAVARVSNTTAMTPLRTQEAVDAIFAATQTITPTSSTANVVFNNLTLPRYTLLLDGIIPNTGSNTSLVLQVSTDNGATWTNVYSSESVNWQANGGLSGVIQFFTAPCIGYAVTGYRNVAASGKNGSKSIVPMGSGPVINAARILWNSGNFGTAANQKIQLFRE